jgi:hypothetical protein
LKQCASLCYQLLPIETYRSADPYRNREATEPELKTVPEVTSRPFNDGPTPLEAANIGPTRDLKMEVSLLKDDRSWSKSAIISLGRQSRQIFFDETNAIPMFTKKIKEIWGIPRKIYWLSVNGKHESTVTSSPHVSMVVIQIKGPAGAVTAHC